MCDEEEPVMALANYILMNKKTPVLAFEYDLDTHSAARITSIETPQAAPLGMQDHYGAITKHDLNYWWRHRAIPASRAQVNRLLENLRLESTIELAEKNFGLSLSDRYWINDEADPKNWDDINFFDNGFDDDLGFLTLGQDSGGSSPDAPDYRHVSLSSPNSTLGGDLMKKWKIIDGERILLKAGVGAFNQEPYNEVAATELHRRLMQQGEYVPYHLFEDGRRVYSACANMLGPDEELVPAWDIIRNVKKSNNLSDVQFYVRRCVDLGLDENMVWEQLAKMFSSDFVTANRDRHYRNFGVIRNVGTYQVTRLAPVFDSGSCLWSDVEFLDMPSDYAYKAKPFKYNGMRPIDQVRLFEGHFDWFDEATLDDYPDRVAAILSRNPNMTEKRIQSVVDEVRRRAEQLVLVAR